MKKLHVIRYVYYITLDKLYNIHNVVYILHCILYIHILYTIIHNFIYIVMVAPPPLLILTDSVSVLDQPEWQKELAHGIAGLGRPVHDSQGRLSGRAQADLDVCKQVSFPGNVSSAFKVCQLIDGGPADDVG